MFRRNYKSTFTKIRSCYVVLDMTYIKVLLSYKTTIEGMNLLSFSKKY